MNSLDPKLRRDLEKAIINARDVAEEAAEQALDRLSVANPEPFPQMTVAERELRNRLRAKGRQLGDIMFENRKQSIHRLIAECAYEHWHQMLFSRFLAENNLLMNSENVPVTLAECEELASHEGAADGWMLASRYASHMLPQIFRPDDVVLQVQFAPEHLHELEAILSSLPTDVFIADDSLGWVYQFWQSKKKDEINKSEKKIGADELPAVTQLFTEDYMVLFLLHNTIGAWWTARLLDNGKISKEIWYKCTSEDDCRRLVTTGAITWEYLRFLKDTQTGEWLPAAGLFSGWPKRVRELTILDPCCGSGHFLVAAFIILVHLLMHEEKLSAQDSSDVVLKNCLYGLEIDQRCTQIAAFALALAVWKFPKAGGYRALPKLNIACSGLSVGTEKADWLSVAGEDTRLKEGMQQLQKLFEKAPILGSLLDPKSIGNDDLIEASFTELRPLIQRATEVKTKNSDLNIVAVLAQDLASAAHILIGEYILIATNVPYVSLRKQSAGLKDYTSSQYQSSKQNLATVFLERCIKLCAKGGCTALVIPQNWFFSTSYSAFREKLLEQITIDLACLMGVKAFSTEMWDFGVLLNVVTNFSPQKNHAISVIDISQASNVEEKSMATRSEVILRLSQQAQRSNPDHRILLSQSNYESLLADHVISPQGVKTGDDDRWRRNFWEFQGLVEGWQFYQSTVGETTLYGGRHFVVDWRTSGKGMVRPRIQNTAVGKQGICISQMGSLFATLYTGERYESSVAVVVPNDVSNMLAIWSFCSSPHYLKSVRELDPNLFITNQTLIKIPFDLQYWKKVASERFPKGLPQPYSFDPTQWLFKGEIQTSKEPLQVEVARLLGYRWPEQKPDKLDMHADDDGVVGIPAIMREKPASERLRDLFATVYGKEWSPSKENELLQSVGFGESNLDDWISNGFFEQHCKLFHQHPFIWHIWDGRKDGFGVLVNYHKLNHQLLERITYTYLNEWIKRQEDSAAHGEGGAESRLIAAKDLQKKLKLILEGEPPFDIFVRWKPIEEQPIGWNPDLNDGIRINIRPFVEANVLRKYPNIHWNKDRGKDVESAPWYKVFKGERINDCHLTNNEKKHAREQKGL